jgi:RNA polymerase sigma factor (sigma-70 family)
MPMQAPETPPPTFARADDPFHTLCNSALDGDQTAFSQLYQRLGGGIRNLFLQRSGRLDIAEDLSQRTWAAFWQALKQGKYDPSRAAVSTFLYAIASKIWLQHLRTAKRSARERAHGGDDLAPPIADIAGGNPADAMRLGELLQAVRECLAGAGDLTEEERFLVRSVSGGETDRALAKRLGISPSTANARKRAAFEKVRRYLATRGHRSDFSERAADDSE